MAKYHMTRERIVDDGIIDTGDVVEAAMAGGNARDGKAIVGIHRATIREAAIAAGLAERVGHA